MPGQVRGIVLVDSSSPNVSFEHDEQSGRIVNPIAVGAATGTNGVPASAEEMARFLNSQRKALFVQMDEIANFPLSATQVINEEALRDLPLLVIARDLPEQSITSRTQIHREATWRRAQLEITTLSDASRLVLAEGSDHFIHLRKPRWLAHVIESFITDLTRDGI